MLLLGKGRGCIYPFDLRGLQPRISSMPKQRSVVGVKEGITMQHAVFQKKKKTSRKKKYRGKKMGGEKEKAL